MPYGFQSRLAHNSERMRVLNTEDIVYIGNRGGVVTMLSIPASPILGEVQEIDPGISVTRVEEQIFGIDIVYLDTLFPPEPGDQIYRVTGEQFVVASCSANQPPYKFARSTRDRILVETKITKDAS